jgi:hypothetical protein
MASLGVEFDWYQPVRWASQIASNEKPDEDPSAVV